MSNFQEIIQCQDHNFIQAFQMNHNLELTNKKLQIITLPHDGNIK